VSKLQLAQEYLDLVERFPVKIKGVVFHIRRMLKDELAQYQLLDDCLSASSLEQVRSVVERISSYREHGGFEFDARKAQKIKEAAELKKKEEGKRKAFEERMVRKAKREGKALDFYLNQGAGAPSSETIEKLKSLNDKEEAFKLWKTSYSQHCFAFHFDPSKCGRERTCPFLHADPAMQETLIYG
jgi:hypothetical protein